MGVRIPIDETAFDVLDDKKAWILGLLWSDGSLMPLGRDRYMLKLSSIDRIVPETLASILNSSHKIGTINCPPWSTCYRIQIGIVFNPLAKHLIDLGYARYKDDRTPPKIPSDLLPAFIRGYFDGDGCVSIVHIKPRKKDYHYLRCYLAGPLAVSWVEPILRDQSIKGSISEHDGRKRLCLSHESSLRLYDYMYRPGCICLARKRKIFERFLKCDYEEKVNA